MADKPLSDGLKLSMLIEPVSKRPPRPTSPVRRGGSDSVSQVSSRTATWAETTEDRPMMLKEARFRSDLFDFMVILPVAALLLFGLPFLLVLSDSDPESHAGGYAAIGAFFLMIPLGIPIAAMVYAGLAYGIFGSTFGKRKQGLQVINRNGTAASRKRKILRPFIKWGLFLITFVAFSIGTTLFSSEDWRQRSGVNASNILFVLIVFGTIPSILIFIVADRILPVVTRESRSLTDMVTRTRVTQNRIDI